MANRYAIASGNWSNPAIWDGGVAVPGAGDVVRPNGYTVTIDVDATVAEIRNDAGGGAAANGAFVLSDGVTLTANVYPTYSGVPFLTYAGVGDAYVIGDLEVRGVTGYGVYHTGTGHLHWTGNLTGSGNSSQGIEMTGGGDLTVTGNVTGGNSVSNQIHYKTVAGGTITVHGNLIGGTWSSGYPVIIDASCTVVINGNLTGGAGSQASQAMYVNGSGTITINGDILAGDDHGVYVAAGGNGFVMTVVGSITASPGLPGIKCVASYGTVVHQGNQISGADGAVPIQGVPTVLIHATVAMRHTYRSAVGTSPGDERTLYTANDPAGFDVPAEADVREGTVYADGANTGSLIVPDPQYVLAGVPTDDTVGTATPSLSAAEVRVEIDANSTQLAAIKAKTDTIGAASVTVRSPVAQSGDVTIEAGDDYLVANGRALTWTDTAGTFPDLTGATFVLRLRGYATTFVPTCTNPGDPAQVIQQELTAAQTAAMPYGPRGFEIVATLADLSVVTLVQGVWAVEN